MAKQTFGIGGPWTGQIGKTYVGMSVVNGHAIRKYIVPPNPKTSAQVAQRGKFGLAGRVASLLVDSIIKDLWNPKAVNVYGVNNFTGVNTKLLSSDTNFPSIVVSRGGYEPVASIISAIWTSGTGILHIIWSTAITSVGNAADKVYVIVIDAKDYDPPSDKFNLLVYVDSTKARSDGAGGVDIDVGTGADYQKLHVYIGLRNPVAETKLKVAASKYSAASLP